MATIDRWLEFQINLTDKSTVTALQAAHPAGVKISPNEAAHTYAVGGVDLGIQMTTDPVVNPGIRSAFFITGGNFPRDVQQFNRKSGGWFGIPLLFGDTIRYHWYGRFVYAGGSGTVDGEPVEDVAIAKRKFIIGFESGEAPEMQNAGSGSANVMREASRHTDGMGFYYAGSSEYITSPTQSGDAAAGTQWDRFYFRPMHEANVTSRMWRVKLAGGASRGASLNFTVDRRLVVHNIGDGGTETPIGTTSDQFEIGTWYRADILTECKAPGGNLRLYINGELVMTALGVGTGSNGGINNNDTIQNVYMGGGALGGTTDTFQCYFDDWIGAAWPTEDSDGEYVGKDWLNGSRVVMAHPSGTATGNNFLGDYRGVRGEYASTNVGASGGNVMTSIVSGDALRLTVRDEAITAVPGSIGVVAFMVAYFGKQATAGVGTLGWKFDGLIDLAAQANVTETTTNNWSRRWHRPSGQINPIANLAPFELHKVKAANINQADCYAFVLIAEHIGNFGDCDVKEDDTEGAPSGLPESIHGVHMAPYPTTPWARQQVAPTSPVIIHTGTYTGNGTIQELQFRAPVTWLMIRRATTTLATGGFWWTSLAGFHAEGEQALQPAVHALIDPAFVPAGTDDTQEQRTLVRINGAHPQVNAAAVAYQYVAFEDPGCRYMINGIFHALSTAFATREIDFKGHSTFTPRWSFMHCELHSNTSATYERGTKGPGHAANAASIMNIAENATGWTHDIGGMTADDLLMDTSVAQTKAWSAWRSDDQSSDPNKLGVVAIGSYIGDGAASRTINFATTGTKRPVYAIVQPLNATPAHHRDPSHTTNTSNAMGTGSSTATGITAGGVDSFTVGTTLNANGIVYNYFVLIGSATAGNGGWSVDGEFAVVEPDAPSDGDYDDPDDLTDPDPVPEDPDPDPGEDDEDDCDAGEVCVAATTRIVNQALLEIGSTKILTNYCTQDTIEAQTARILYEPSVRAVLHAFPWPFATKYAALALATTQPTDSDWEYSYRQPTDCIFERRISVEREGALNPTPPPFELSSDTVGGLIFTNEPNAVLEYTKRPSCVAFTGDALFREALVWHLASKMAPPVTRMADKAKFCREEFEKCIDRANAIIRPGDPGLRVTPTWQAVDNGAGAMAANVAVANVGLLRIGANTIANLLDDQSREAVAVNLIFEHELRATLRDYPWKFAKRYNDALVTVGGTSTVPVNADWQYSYRLPTDYIAVRRLPTTGTGRSFERNPKTFEVGTDDVGDLLFTGELDPNLEYTARIANTVLRADDLFRDALAWRLAASLAPSLAQVDPERQEQIGRGPEHPPDNTQRVSHKPNKAAMRQQAAVAAFRMYLRAIEKARVADANESDPEPDGDAEWIEGRS